MNVMHHGTLRRKTKDSIEIKIINAFLNAVIQGDLNRNGGYIEIEDISNVDSEYMIKYLGGFGFKASYKPVEEQCLGTYSDDCLFPMRHVFELKPVNE